MIAILLMVIGAILAIAGFLGLLALVIEPLHTMYMVIFKRKDDYVYYETKPGKALLQKNKKSLRGSCIFLLVVGILMFSLGFFLKFSPRGLDSLFSKQVENGAQIGDAESGKGLKEAVNAAGNYVDEQGQEHYDYLTIRGTTIRYREEKAQTIQEFAESLEELRKIIGKREIYLVDDFASAPTYHQVEEMIEEVGIYRYKGGEE
ncbi:MAG: hypothetical protein IKO41_19860 [Lachnospiraceae bacterium]|nr:hypothetical protein [Lachnospiraceae bacterium]